MFYFITPLRAPALTLDWARTSKLFERTAASVFRQTMPDFRHIVICHEPPTLTRTYDDRLQFIKVDLPMETRPTQFTSQVYPAMSRDKVNKLLIGLGEARKRGASFVMLLDADDLVSNRLVEYVVSNPDADGWYVKCGWRYVYGQPWMTIADEFNKVCSSCHVLSRRWFAFPDDPGREREVEAAFISQGHEQAVDALAALGAKLRQIPFRAVVATESGENMSIVKHIKPGEPSGPARSWLRRLAGRAMLQTIRWYYRRPLGPGLRREFAIERSTV